MEWVKTELYLGRGITAGYEVSDVEFADFVSEVIAKLSRKD